MAAAKLVVQREHLWRLAWSPASLATPKTKVRQFRYVAHKTNCALHACRSKVTEFSYPDDDDDDVLHVHGPR